MSGELLLNSDPCRICYRVVRVTYLKMALCNRLLDWRARMDAALERPLGQVWSLRLATLVKARCTTRLYDPLILKEAVPLTI